MTDILRTILSSALLLLLASSAAAQSYGASLGIRLGNNPDSRSIGITSQYRLAKELTVEGVIESNFRHDNYLVHLMIERHRKIISRRMNFYVGVGMSFGNELSTTIDPISLQEIRTYGNKTIGTDLIFGAETTLLGYNLSVDYKPNINLIGREPWYMSQVGISVRQVIIKSGAQKKRKRQRERAKRRKEREKERSDEPWLRDWWDRTFGGG